MRQVTDSNLEFRVELVLVVVCAIVMHVCDYRSVIVGRVTCDHIQQVGGWIHVVEQ